MTSWPADIIVPSLKPARHKDNSGRHALGSTAGGRL